ncbi:hypothetical protein [Brevundimonas sp. M20]|uniref:hypothetical protein n=1 Tax=Brevundimonas sp. M20 TaxID=2591463 RepID=UPI0011467BA9|nr:hypothetical protein [Brevundimonas sp. M20]QDH74635.1 hypothetical protein FKQ52_15205 [Brevundimonas sp. M20]
MTHDTDNTSADIAWLRQLAEENGAAPMRGASILLAAGLIYGLTSLLHWAHMTGLIAPRLVGAGMDWLIATGLFLIVNFALILRLRRAEGVRTAADRAIGTVWAGVGFGIFVLFASMMTVTLRLGADQNGLIFWMVPSIIMVFYGMGWSVTAAMLKSGPLWWLGVASFIAAPALGALSGQPAQYLGYAAALFLLMALPGFLLMRRAKQA